MEQWKGKVAMVSGASGGIGSAIIEDLVKNGLTVIGTARRIEQIEELAERLQGEQGRLIPRKLDVSNEKEVIGTFQWAEAELGGVDILVNNAGYMGTTPVPEISLDELKKTFDTNVIGLTLCCREAIQSMQRRGQKHGHIININSVLGHTIPKFPGFSLSIYPASKFAVTATGELLRSDLSNMGYSVRITSISPGIVDTAMSSPVRSKFEGIPALKPEDIAQSVHFALSVPPHVEISELTIQPIMTVS